MGLGIGGEIYIQFVDHIVSEILIMTYDVYIG